MASIAHELRPVAAGTLERRPFAELLIEACDRRLTGTLVLEEPGGERHGVYFESGEPGRAKVEAAGFHLGEVLIAQGKMTRDLHRATLERALAATMLHGQLLLQHGFVSPKSLSLGLREQLLRKVAWLFARPRGTRWGFFAGRDVLGLPGGVQRVRALEALWRGIRDELEAEEIETLLARVSGLPLVLRSGLPKGHFDFMGEANELVRRLAEAPACAGELRARDPERDALVARVVYFLVVTRSVRLGGALPAPLGVDDALRVNTGCAREFHPATIAADHALRAAHSAAVDGRAGLAKTAQLSAAELAFLRAESLLERGSLADARREVARSLALEPERAETIALDAWLDSALPEVREEELFGRVECALRAGKQNARAHFYAGLTLRRLGREAAALKAFRAVTELSPGHVGAARELHLALQQRRRAARRGWPVRAFELLWSAVRRLFARGRARLERQPAAARARGGGRL